MAVLAVPPSSKIGQALPEDMFAAPAPGSHGNNIRVQAGLPSSQRQGSQQQQGFGSSPKHTVPNSHAQGFTAFSGAPSTEVQQYCTMAAVKRVNNKGMQEQF